MVAMFLNPGTSPVRGAKLSLACAALAVFVEELKCDRRLKIKRDKKGDGEGWFGFNLSGRRKVSVLVPGLPLDALRCTPQDVRERWGLRRLYVEGNSYYWCYAIDVARMAINKATSDE